MPKSTKALEAIAALKQLRSAPSVIVPGKLSELEKAVLESKGQYGAKRVQKAADEIKNLEQQFKLDALRSAFLGDNAKALMIGKPGEFQRFAAKVDEPYRPAVDQYLREMSRQGGGAADVPFLEINRQAPEWLPNISGHEGRHRNIAMDELGHESTLWSLLPRAALREHMPRRSQEEYLEALKQELGLNRFVTPESRSLLPIDLSASEHQNLERRGMTAGNRPELPEPFASGGMAKGGQKVNKAVRDFIDPPTQKLQDWNWRPLEAVSKDLNLTEIPDYIQKGYGSFMADQAARAAAGDLTSRDLLKAYLITQSSIGRQGRSYNTATKAGLKVPRTDELVRPEGAFAAWLGSKSGQRYLDAAMKGELDKKAVAEIQSQFAPFGKQNVLGKAMVGAVDMVPKMAPTLNQSIMGLPDDYRDYAEQLKGIAAAKSGFVGSLLGRGDLPTFDARQIYLHTAGQPLPTKIPESILDRGKGLGGREAVDRLAARQDALGLKLDPALDPYYQHLAHHAVWDKSGKSETTHQDLIDAMINYKDGGPVHMLGGGLSVFDQPTEDELAAARKAAYGRQRMSGAGFTRPEAEEPEEREQAVVKAYEPTWKQQIDAGLQAGLRKLGSPSNRARQLSGVMSGHNESGLGAIDFVPFLGTAVGIEESGRAAMEDLRQGDALSAALNIGLGVLPGAYSTIKATPGATRALKGAVRRGQSEIDRGLVGQGSLASLMDVDANKARLMLREGPGRAPADLSPDAMRIKAWDKKIKGKAAGGQVQHLVKGGKALFSGLDRLVNPPKDIAKTLGAEARSARQQAIEAEGRRAEAAKNLEPTVGYRPTTPLNPDPLVGTRYKVGPTKDIITAPAFDPDKHIGANTLVLDWDSTSRNTPIKEVSGNKVNIPTHGGYQWTLDQGNIARGSGGASGPTIVPRILTRMNNSAREGIEQGGTGEALSIMQTMGEGAENFALPKSQFLFKLVNQRLKEGAITEDDANKLLGLIQTRNPGLYGDLSNFAGFSPKGWRQIHKNAKESGLLVPESESTTSGKLRTGIGHVADMAATQKMLGYNIEDLTNALTAEKLRGVPKGHMGAVVMRNPEGGVEMMESPLYPYKSPYSHEWTADPVGEFPEMIDTQALMYRAMSPVAKDLLARANRIPYTSTTLRNAVLGSLTKNNENVSQIIDPQFSDDYYTYMRELGKKNEQKDGGAVNMADGGQSRQPVDRSLPDLGSEERLRMEDYLRRMRFTGGGSGDKYGTGVGGRAMMNFPVGPAVVQPYVGGGVYKPQGGKLTGGVSEAGVNFVIPFADGGEVSADDLIVEERPL
jgi:hypothetical protein